MTAPSDGGSSAHGTTHDAPVTDAPEDTAESQGQLPLVWFLVIGAAAALVGLLPWLITGARLPLQNLWATPTSPEQMPIALLPFSQYELVVIVGLIVTGSAIAGVAARSVRARQSPHSLRMVLLGVLVVQAIAAVQTTAVVMNGLERSNWADLYLAALVAVTALAVLTGILVLLLIAKSPVPGAVIALAIAALATGVWLSALVAPFGSIQNDLTTGLLDLVRWVPAVIIGAALAWSGFHTIGRVVAGAVAILILWIGPTVFTAVSAAAGTRVLATRPAEMLDYGIGVFNMALWLPELVLPRLIVAAVVGILGWLGLRFLRTRSDAAAPREFV
ncbi:hypothetical protein [Diaminobutyricimonas sp. LJ205]|uniref:hypothetical protein n=1 Tax=Diaminobutyricimonas sp. LJ205 TaxID=2683590 RepID=UPI0012F4B5DF|nr:hypothetical protein [Diaminobutyricimonas sp. LJ205]